MKESIRWLQSRSNEELLTLQLLFRNDRGARSTIGEKAVHVDAEVRRRALNMASFMSDLDIGK
jgi:hypothetical protein